MEHRKGDAYIFSVAAAVAAITGNPSTAKAVCDCTMAAIAPASIRKTYGPDVFVPVSGTAMYTAELAGDGLYTWKTNLLPPTVWVDYMPNSAASQTVSYQVCRYNYLGTSISCGSVGSNTTTSAAQVEKLVSLSTGVYSPSMSDWDRIRLAIWSGITVKPVTVPVIVQCW